MQKFNRCPGSRATRRHGLSSRTAFILALLALAAAHAVLSPLPARAQEIPRVLRAAVPGHFPPQYVVDRSGEPAGFAIDVFDSVAESLGFEVEYMLFDTWPQAMQALEQRTVDIIPNMGIRPDRQAFAGFTTPVETIALALFVRSHDNTIAGLNDLTGRQVSVVKRNAGEQLLRSRPDVGIVVHDNRQSALLALLAGRSDAAIYPRSVFSYLAREAGVQDRIRAISPPLLEVKRAIGVRNDRPDVLAELDGAVRRFILTPQYKALWTKWHGAPQPYWSVQKVAVAFGALLAVVVAGLVVWRYRSVVNLNRLLLATVKQREATQTALDLRNRCVEATDDAVLITGPAQADCPIVSVNRAFKRMTGYGAEEVLGRNPRFLQGNDCDQAGLEDVRVALRDGRSVRTTLRNYRKDGSLFQVELHVSPVEDSNGQLTHFIGIQRDVTDLLTAQEALQDGEARFRDFAETAADWFWEMGRDLRFTHMTGNVQSILGVDPESFIGRTRQEVHRPSEDDPLWSRHFEDIAAHKPFQDLEVPWIRPDGERRVVVLNGRPLFDGGGEFIGYRGTGRDVSALHRARLELRQSHALLEQRVQERTRMLREEVSLRQHAEEKTRTLLEHAPDVIIIIDRTGKIEFANMQTEQVLGYSSEELIGQPIERLVPERLRAGHVAHRSAFVGNPTPRPMGTGLQLYALRGDGVEIPIEVSLSPIHTEHGLVVAASIRDITERKAAEFALRESEERYRSLFENTSDLIQSVTPDGSFAYVNPAWRRTLGYTEEEVERLSVFDVIHPDCQAHCRKVFERLMTGEAAQHIEAQFVTKSGQPLYVEGNATCHFRDGKPVMTRALFHDVTSRMEALASIRDAKEAAEKATATKTRFLAAASHDLRQPLQSLELYLSVLSRATDPTQAQSLQAKMQHSLDTMEELLNALLDISKLDSGSVDPDVRDFALQPLLERVIASAAPHAQDKGLELRCTHTSCIVHSDPALLERVLENLMGNAIRYTDEGHVSLRCPVQDNAVRIEVRDTGVGIPEHALETIFEEYVQLDNPVRDRQKGLGLGLAIVKHIADLLGHPLSVASVPDDGSIFSVVVPLGDEAVTEASSTTVPVASEPSDTQPGQLTVLFVDDDSAIVDALSLLLSMSGFSVHAALNGEDAMAFLAQGLRPDIVVSDFRLPGETGIALIRRIREHTGVELPAILMTGDTATAGLRAANVDNLQIMHKPVQGNRLIELIEQMGGRTQTQTVST
ncbi:MAG: PAS domain S-box protein [Gammaproteobacteria bacterium]